MKKLLSVLLVDRRAEGREEKRRKRPFTLLKAFQKAVLNHLYEHFVRVPRTPVPQLFKANGVPSDEDLAKMRAYIHQLQQIVISTETSPSTIKRYEGNRVYEIGTRHTRLLQNTTIRNLSPEIIQRIVHFSLSPSPTSVRKDCLPWVASWVCSSWRRTVLGHHHLWGTLPLINLGVPFVRSKRETKFLQELLRRSGDASLSVSVTFTGDADGDYYNHTLLDILMAHSHRYADVRLTLSTLILSSLVMPTLSRWRRLRHLSLEIKWANPYIPPETLCFDLRRFTSLRSIDVPNNIWPRVLLPSHMENPTLYSGGVKALSLSEGLELTLNFLTTTIASSVTKLVLPAHAHGQRLGDEFSPVFAPRVTEIVLYEASRVFDYWSSGLMALEGFVTPCLRTLKISFARTFTLDRLTSRLAEATSLTTLHLLCRSDSSNSPPNQSPHSVGLSMATLTTLLESTPNIVDFKIFDDTSSYSFIHLLAYFKKPRKDWDSYPIPRLKNLTIFVRWDISPHVLDLLHYVAISRMERPPPYGDNHFSRLETLEVVLNGAGDFTPSSPLSVKMFGADRPLAPHAAQDHVRGVMEGWVDFKGHVGSETCHLSLVAVAEEMRDLQTRLARLSHSVDEPPPQVFADMERCLESLVESLGSDGSLRIEPIEIVYLSGAFWSLCDLKNALESGCRWRMPGFSMLHHTSVRLAARILEEWEPRLTKLVSRTRWFNLGEDSLIFLPLDDPRRTENETKDCLANGFSLFNNGSQRSDLVLPPLPPAHRIWLEL